ncbi:MAG: alpha/beta hydrolase [Burkholderiaceae bacterium]|nr:alpha/beta hydrolase [Burkholderiaceae bacterium]
MRGVTPASPASGALARADVERVVERIRKVYGGWTRNTPVARMRADWDALFDSDRVAAGTEAVVADGVDACWVAAPGRSPDRVLLYFHGGGFRVGSVRSHRGLIARISGAANCKVLGVDYRLAPEHRFPAPLEDAVAAYRWLLGQGYAPRCIAFAGDSAGGGLALSALLALRADRMPLPAAVVVLSPWTDLTASGESYESRARADPIHQRPMIEAMARSYLGESGDARDPLASPLFADLRGLPPVLVQVGGRETVLDDSRAFAARARAAGVEVELEIWEEMIHVFQQFADELPDAGRAIRAIGTFLDRHWRAV